jgi:TRAP-type mannitol/chloroaromatic compound transport system permease small subunit
VVKAIERFIDWTGRATSWLAMVIVVLMATNVVLRYLFSYGSVWAQELEWHLLAPLILFGIAYALLKGEHVRVDVLYARFSRKSKERVNLVSALLCLAISLIIVYLSIHYVQQAYVIDEKSADPGGLTHRWVLKAFIPVGFALLALQSVAEIVKSWRRMHGKRA